MSDTAKSKKAPNPYRISIEDLAENEGYADVTALLAFCNSDSVVPALCSEGCQVENDGRCEHGCPAPFVAMGMM